MLKDPGVGKFDTARFSCNTDGVFLTGDWIQGEVRVFPSSASLLTNTELFTNGIADSEIFTAKGTKVWKDLPLSRGCG